MFRYEGFYAFSVLLPSAWFGGGTIVRPVIEYLWDKGYVTTTGGCECVGMLGARSWGVATVVSKVCTAWLETIFGSPMLSLANGAAIRVNATSHGDLLWGMKGAGHNFGIVTSYEMGIYPRGPATRHYHNYVWRGEHLEAVFNALNKLHGDGTAPVNMAIEA